MAINRAPLLAFLLLGLVIGTTFVIAIGLKATPEKQRTRTTWTALAQSAQEVIVTSSLPPRHPASPSTKPPSKLTAQSSSPPPPPSPATQTGAKTQEKQLVCLYGAYAAYRDGLGQFTTDKIDPFLCTHIIHGTFGFNENNSLESPHSNIDFDEEEGSFGLLKQLSDLKQFNPSLKTMISVGGSDVTSGEFSFMASQPESRQQFITSVLEFLARHNLDGVDINWQFPAAFTGEPVDKENFVLLLQELAAALHPQGLLLSAQVAAAYPLIKLGYDIPRLSQPLDLILLMAYDYSETRENRTSLIAPLYAQYGDPLDRDNVKWSVEHWLKAGAPADKLVLGVTAYAFAFTLDSPGSSHIGAPASEPGEEGEWTKNPGLLGYNEVCSIIMRNRWRIVQDPDLHAVYAVRGRQWISYESRRTLALKARFAASKGLAGVALYSLDTDDFKGRCHGSTYPLARRIKQVLRQAASQPHINNPPTIMGEQKAERDYAELSVVVEQRLQS